VRPLALFLLYLLTGFRSPHEGMPPAASSCTSTPYTPHHKRHGLQRHDIAGALSHPTIFELNALFKLQVCLIFVALVQALFPFLRIPTRQAREPARLAVRARIHYQYMLSLQCVAPITATGLG
jgi:hypothetical protein